MACVDDVRGDPLDENRISSADLAAVVAEARRRGAPAVGIEPDLTDEAQVEAAVSAVVAE